MVAHFVSRTISCKCVTIDSMISRSLLLERPSVIDTDDVLISSRIGALGIHRVDMSSDGLRRYVRCIRKLNGVFFSS